MTYALNVIGNVAKSKALEELDRSKKELEQRTKEIINENNLLKSTLNKIFDLFPHIKELLTFEKFCRAVGFDAQMIQQLFNRETVIFKGEIYSQEHQRKFKTERSLAKVDLTHSNRQNSV